MKNVNTTSPAFLAAVAAEVAKQLAAQTPAPRARRADASEAQALELARQKFGSRGCVWIVTHDTQGKKYKSERYRIGWTVDETHGRFIEDGRRIWGVGNSWSEAMHSARTYTPGTPVVHPTPEDDSKPKAAKPKAARKPVKAEPQPQAQPKADEAAA